MSDAEDARDPATPPERLLELLVWHTEAVLANPGFALLRVEQPDWCDRIQWEARSHGAASPQVPLELVHWVLQRGANSDGMYHLVLNRAVSLPLRRAAFVRLYDTMRIAPAVRGAWAEFLTAAEVELLERPEAQPVTDAEIEVLLALGAIGLEVAKRHPGFSTAWLERLFALGRLNEYDVLLHPECEPSRLLCALDSADELTRSIARGHARTPADALARLADDPNPLVRKAVGHNAALPQACVERLLRDPDVRVRVELADRNGLTEAQCAVLAADPEAQVREQLDESYPVGPDGRRR